jgi:phosphatidylethanolamine-binding protein (PEBP) family uncharacterized protein
VAPLASLAAAIALTAPWPNGGTIPKRYTCDGAGAVPHLRWTHVPRRTRELVLEVLDPDAPGGTFVHWLWAGSPATPGRNSAGSLGYTGPCPPPGKPHRYVFRLYALDRRVPLPRGFDDAQLRAAIRGHVLATGTVLGRYGR